MKQKSWFVIMQEEEIMKLSGANEVAVFAAIKSYCANGKQRRAVPLRDIAQRARVSKDSVRRTIPTLVSKKMVRIVGKEIMQGGECPIYEASQVETVRAKKSVSTSNGSVSTSNGSVSTSNGSVSTVGTKPLQSNKGIKEEKKKERIYFWKGVQLSREELEKTLTPEELKECDRQDELWEAVGA